MKAKHIYLIVLIFFFSCGRNSKQSEIINNQVIVDGELIEIPDSININNSSSDLVWRNSYSEKIIRSFDEYGLSQILEKSISFEDLDILKCKNYNELPMKARKLFWVNLFSSIAESESDFDNYSTTKTPSDGTLNIGLLQIDISSANRHSNNSGIHFVKNDLFIGEQNLLAGMFIMRNQLNYSNSKDRIFPNSIYYWEVLHHPARMIQFFHSNLDQLKFCQKS